MEIAAAAGNRSQQLVAAALMYITVASSNRGRSGPPACHCPSRIAARSRGGAVPTRHEQPRRNRSSSASVPTMRFAMPPPCPAPDGSGSISPTPHPDRAPENRARREAALLGQAVSTRPAVVIVEVLKRQYTRCAKLCDLSECATLDLGCGNRRNTWPTVPIKPDALVPSGDVHDYAPPSAHVRRTVDQRPFAISAPSKRVKIKLNGRGHCVSRPCLIPFLGVEALALKVGPRLHCWKQPS